MATPIENNTEGLQKILQLVNSLPSGQKYGKLVVFGDSAGAGTNNNNYSFVDILSESGMFESVVKACVGGATIGPYQVTSSASNYDLNSQIERYASDVRSADIILLEYGSNDVGAVESNSVTMGGRYDDATATTVCGYTQKAINRLRELNPTAAIHWLMLFSKTVAEAYNTTDIPVDITADRADVMVLFMYTALKKVMNSGIYVVDASAVYGRPECMSNDNIHTNTAGHKVIAEQILHGLFRSADVLPPERLVKLSGNVADPSTFKVNVKYANLKKLLEAETPSRMVATIDLGSFTTQVVCSLFVFNDYQIAFGNICYNANDPYPMHMEVVISSNDSLNVRQYAIGSVN